MFRNHFLIRNIEGMTLRENFLLSSVVTVIVIRIFLNLTSYPQLGGGNFHIAHMVWGGLLMMASIIILISYLNHAATHASSIIGGVGFGIFIDELGKFITKDNNYFFQPTIAFIYVIFIFIFLIARLIPRYKDISRTEYLVNAVELMKEAIINDLDPAEKTKAIEFLNKSDASDPVVVSLKKLMSDVEHIPMRMGPVAYFRKNTKNLYQFLAKSRITFHTILITLIIQAGTNLVLSFNVIITNKYITFDEWGKFISSFISVLFVILGIITFRTSRLKSFNYFKIAILTSILLTQFFMFYQEQLSAVIYLIINILLLLIIDFAIFQEQDINQNGRIVRSEIDL